MPAVKTKRGKKMKINKSMRALSLLLVMALLTAVFVPAVSAEIFNDGKKEIREAQWTYSSIIQKSQYDNYNDFCLENSKYYKYLSEKFGKAEAEKFFSDEYKKISSELEKNRDAKVSTQITHLTSNIYFWPYGNRDTLTSPNSGPVNVIFLNTDRTQITSDLKNTGDWVGALGFTEYGLCGPSTSQLVWRDSHGGGIIGDQLEAGNPLFLRYHLVLFDGFTDPVEGDWSYGNCHIDEFRLPLSHVVPEDGCNDGRHYIQSFTSQNLNVADDYYVNLQNRESGSPWYNTHDGYGITIEMS